MIPVEKLPGLPVLGLAYGFGNDPQFIAGKFVRRDEEYAVHGGDIGAERDALRGIRLLVSRSSPKPLAGR